MAKEAEQARWEQLQGEELAKSRRKEQRWEKRMADDARTSRHNQLKNSFKKNISETSSQDRMRERDSWTSPIPKDSSVHRAKKALKGVESPIKHALKHAETHQMMKQQLKMLRSSNPY